jgi:hypothetical protein
MKPGASVPVIDAAARQDAGGASSWCSRRPDRGVERRTARTPAGSIMSIPASAQMREPRKSLAHITSVWFRAYRTNDDQRASTPR